MNARRLLLALTILALSEAYRVTEPALSRQCFTLGMLLRQGKKDDETFTRILIFLDLETLCMKPEEVERRRLFTLHLADVYLSLE